jgi:hypothetical protein
MADNKQKKTTDSTGVTKITASRATGARASDVKKTFKGVENVVGTAKMTAKLALLTFAAVSLVRDDFIPAYYQPEIRYIFNPADARHLD